MLKKNKIDDLFIRIGIFIFLFYSFNCSLLNIAINARYFALFFIFAFVCIAFGGFNNFVRNKKRSMLLLAITMAICLFVICRNMDFKNGIFSSAVFICMPILSIPFLSCTSSWIKYMIKLIRFFVCIHIFSTFFCAIFSEFYYKNIMPLFPDTYSQLLYEFEHSQIAGITSHYSTNGLYLVVGLIINTTSLFHKKDSVNIILFILNFFALLLTGKRGMVLYYIVAVLVMVLVKNRFRFLKSIRKMIIPITAIALLVGLVSFFNGNILNSFTRIIESFNDSEDAFSSRDVLWHEAEKIFDENKLFGAGWGSYKWYYNNDVYYKELDFMQAHCIYLQLLCEVGIVGFFAFIVIMSVLGVLSTKDLLKHESDYIFILFLTFHIYFLLEGITGNSIYDIQIYAPYYMICAAYLCEHFCQKDNIEMGPKNRFFRGGGLGS